MSGQELVQLMSILLFGVALVMILLSWQALGIVLERYTWPHRLYRLVTILVIVAIAAVLFWYFGPNGPRPIQDIRF